MCLLSMHKRIKSATSFLTYTYIILLSFLLGGGSCYQSEVTDDLLRVFGLSGSRLTSVSPHTNALSVYYHINFFFFPGKMRPVEFLMPLEKLSHLLKYLPRHYMFAVPLKCHSFDIQGDEVSKLDGTR